MKDKTPKTFVVISPEPDTQKALSAPLTYAHAMVLFQLPKKMHKIKRAKIKKGLVKGTSVKIYKLATMTKIFRYPVEHTTLPLSDIIIPIDASLHYTNISKLEAENYYSPFGSLMQVKRIISYSTEENVQTYTYDIEDRTPRGGDNGLSYFVLINKLLSIFSDPSTKYFVALLSDW
jgi:hypothetical protein